MDQHKGVAGSGVERAVSEEGRRVQNGFLYEIWVSFDSSTEIQSGS